MSAARALLLSALCCGCATPALAQLTGSLDLGAGTYRPDRSIPGGIASIVPALRYQRDHFEVSALGVYSDAPAGRWNFQGGTEALVRAPALGFFQFEAAGRAEWTSHYRVQGTTTFSGGVRGYFTARSGARAWVGRTFGSASSLGSRRPLRRTEIGGSARLGSVHLQLTVANTTVDRSYMLGGTDPRGPLTGNVDTLPSLPESGGRQPVDRLALTDAVLSGSWRFQSVEFDASLGRRFSRMTPETTIWGLSASRDISPTLALVAAAGRAGSDPVTSVPGARYFALGLRLKVAAAPPAALPIRTASDESAPFRIGPPVAAGREIVIQAPGAEMVELAGDFTDWRPVELRPWGEDSWRTLLPVAPGLHRLAIRVDSGPWRAPPGTRALQSEFGGEVAEVVVE